MKQSTWDLINRKYERFRSYFAEATNASEIDSSFQGFALPADYQEFVRRYGGGMVGTYPIYGLHLAEAMGTIARKSTAPEITKVFRDRKWPGVENWLVFSVDQSGNPIGLADDGSIWISDGARAQIQKMADTFEGFLLRWGLKVNDL